MKKLLVLAGLFAATQSFTVWKVVKGNGIEKNEQRDASGYTAIASGGPISVDISYGSSNSITIEGDENILPYIETRVKDGKLIIKVKDMVSIKPQLNVRVRVSMKTITGISQSGSGSITGSGDFTNDGQANINISGSGNIKLVFAKFNATDISMSGSGAIDLQGDIVQNLDINQSGSGRINCVKAPSQNVSAKISGSGSMKVNALKTISAHISGSGRIYYTGNAEQVNTKVSGSGSIEKI